MGTLRPPFPLLTAEQLEDSPSRRDGVTAAQEFQRRTLAARHIYSASVELKTSAGTAAIAVTLFLRFYCRRSLARNSPFVVAAAALFLAGKVNDEPKGHALVAQLLSYAWYGREAARARWREPAWAAATAGAVLAGEVLLLDTLGFDLHVDNLHKAVAAALGRPSLRAVVAAPEHARWFQQLAVSMCNDVMKWDGALVLQYPAPQLALAFFAAILAGARASGRAPPGLPQPPAGADGAPWHVAEGLPRDALAEITARLKRNVWKTHKADKGGAAAAAGATKSAAGECSSAPGGSAEETAAPAHLAASPPDGGEGDSAPPAAKRPRVGAPGLPPRAPPLAPPPAVFAPAAASQAAAAAATAPAAADDSEPEEGEIEEGEIV